MVQRRNPVAVKCLPVERWWCRTSQSFELTILHERVQAVRQALTWLGTRTRVFSVGEHRRGQACSGEFLLLLTYFSCNALQCQFTVGTVGVQLELKGDEGGWTVDGMTRAFSLCLSLSFLFTPAIGTAFDHFGFPPVMAALNTLLLGVPALLLSSSQGAQIITCILYAAGRVGLWASFFSFTGATFGFRHYGKMAGGGLLVQSLFCLLIYPLLAATLAMDRDFTFVNSLFIALTAAQYLTIFGLHRLGARAASSRGVELQVSDVKKSVQ